ncbi:hypothetical protein SERLA73DRAFT_178344 [Serpula lacrymans var. lacrymans S7.3]|uniref:Uncharacterized protein n=1 Tax=Serpula lacrymans var. lacrymans (strain S7.3) TaxID=936435 RepID=F8PTI2_SERL3|nr:hypothetical protein SERLA73DRAFT_178344 [Serpula lacrymans var. lacrymans S7.3]
MGGTKRRVSVRRKTKERSHAAVATYLQTTDVYAPACATAAATADGETQTNQYARRFEDQPQRGVFPGQGVPMGYETDRVGSGYVTDVASRVISQGTAL